MKEMKRVLALMLCFVMLVGLLPVDALAAQTETTAPVVTEETAAAEERAAEASETETTEETEATDGAAVIAEDPVNDEADVDYLFIATDRHADTAVIGSIIDNMETAIGGNELDYLALGGDMVGSGNSHPEYDSSTVLGEVTNATSSLDAGNVDIVAGIHDMNVNDDAEIVLPYQGGGAQIFEGEKFYVYGVEEYCISEDSTEDYRTAQAQKFVDWAGTVDASKAIVVVSHYPLHSERDDNPGAAVWHAALNGVATDDSGAVVRNVLFFHGHNHTVDKTEHLYTVGSTVDIEGAGNSTIQYTYATAGYLKDNQQATLVAIDADSITLTKYGTGSSQAMTTVARVAQEETEPVKEISYIMLNEGDGAAYDVGDPCILYQVLVTYTDWTSETVTQDVCQSVITNEAGETVDMATAMSTPGTYSATISYQGVTCGTKLSFTVSEIEDGNSSYETLILTLGDGITALEGTVEDATDAEAVVAAMEAEEITDYVAYDITATLAEGQTAIITVPVPETWENTDNLKAFYIDDNGNLAETIEGTFDPENRTFTFQVDHFSTYIVGATGSETSVNKDPVSGEVADAVTGSKTAYVLTTEAISPAASQSDSKKYLIVSTNAAGEAYALGQSTAGVEVTIKAADSSVPMPYIEVDDNALLWNYVENTSGPLVQNVGNSQYLNYSYSSGICTDESGVSWTAGDNTLSYVSRSYTYYLYCNSETWSRSYSSQSVYFFQQMDIPVSGNGTYSIEGNPASISQVVTAEGETATLGSILTFTPVEEAAVAEKIDVSTTATYSTNTALDPAGVISDISGNTLTFSGVYGKAVVEVSYTVKYENTAGETSSVTVTNYIAVEAKAPYYDVEVYSGTADVETVPVKGVTASTTLELTAAVLSYTGGTTGTAVENASVTWEIHSDAGGVLDSITAGGTIGSSVTASVSEGATLNFTGKGGIATIRVKYTYTENGEEKTIYQDVAINASQSDYYVPEDGTTDFPDYPDEGAVVIDKTATAVGDFNKTGIAQVELNMFGVPVNQAKPFDVVLMLDLSNSMKDNSRTTYLKAAAEAFVETICLNSDGSWNKLQHGISVCSYNIDPEVEYPANTTTSYNDDMQDIASLADVNEVITAINDMSRSGGTDYAEALKHAYEILKATKDPDRAQYLIFMSDGAPTSYAYIADSQKLTTSNHTESTIATGVYTDEDGTVYNAYLIDQGTNTGGTYELATGTLKNYDEYYSWLMKQDGVDIHTVGLAITETDDQQIIKNIASAESQAYLIDDGDSEALTNAFVNMAKGFMAAASNVTVNDLIAPSYSMIFELPDGVKEEDTGEQEFYIEVVNYALDENHDRTGASESLIRVYYEGGTFNAYTVTTDTTGNEVKTAVANAYTAAGEGETGYFNLVDGSYVYVSDGTGTYNISAGVYSQGSGDTLVLITPYFNYFAENQQLDWVTDQLGETNQIAIRYFVYLEGSAGSVGDGDETPPGVYQTNTSATVTYTNHLGNQCQQTFPVPQMTWNGAQVGVTFYLVNAAGKPINRSGEEVPLAAAAFVTETFYESVVWNTDEFNPLRATILAQDHLPEGYTLYDSSASYMIHVYEDEQGHIYDNFFIIDGAAEGTTDGTHVIQSDDTTYVYNTINNPNKYTAYGVYSGVKEAGQTVSYLLEDGTTGTETVDYNTGDNIDYSSTNVAFAVLWIPTLTEDTIVVDYGLPVSINVVQNDQLANTVNALGTTVTNGTAVMNTGHYSQSPIGCAEGTSYDAGVLSLANGDQVYNYSGLLYYVQNDMAFDEPTCFYYDTKASFTQENTLIEGYMYSRVNVIPATTVYYEDSFTDANGDDVIRLNYYSESGAEPVVGRVTSGAGWTTAGTTIDGAVQETDRPGDDKFHLPGYDADNNYGYDPVYDTSTQFSLGSAAKVTLSGSAYATAEFDFYGTGFDLISMTSSDTGMITVKVMDANGNVVRSQAVDTYYGYTYGIFEATYRWDGYNWFLEDVAETTETELTELPALEPGTPGTTATVVQYMWHPATTGECIYQVPVINMHDLPWGKYTVKVNAAYSSWLDHVDGSDSYDFYLDAVRIYDPIQTDEVVGDTTVGDIYVKDGEGYPKYTELRDIILTKNDYNALDEGEQTTGAIFIDDVSNTDRTKTYSITDYANYGPNNELYLAAGQTVAFELDLSSYAGKVADVQIGMKSANSKNVYATLAIDGVASNPAEITSGDSSTDRYYSIGSRVDLKGKTVISFTNSSTASGTLLSITNLKLTFTQSTEVTAGTYSVSSRAVGLVLSMLNETAEEEPVVLPDAQLEVSVNGKNVKVGSSITVKATTSEEVDSLTVNGQEVTSFKLNKSTGKRTWTLKLKAEEAGTMDIVVTACSAEGDALDTVTETVEVAEKNGGNGNNMIGQLLDQLFG